MAKSDTTYQRITHLAQTDTAHLMDELQLSYSGLRKKDVEQQRREYGSNELLSLPKDSLIHRLRRAFVNPFSVVLFILAMISLLTETAMISSPSHNYMPMIIISLMLLVSGIVRFIQELHSKKVTDHLLDLVNSPVTVCRDDVWQSVSADELVVGDLVRICAGDRTALCSDPAVQH